MYHNDQFLKEQTQAFETHIEASIKHSLPIIIHQRNSEKEIVEVLTKYKNDKLKQKNKITALKDSMVKDIIFADALRKSLNKKNKQNMIQDFFC